MPHWRRWHGTDLPTFGNTAGELTAYVNHGRWVVSCPNQGCGNAIVASEREPFYICTECGSPENGGCWYRVAYPAEKAAIEEELVRRPALKPFEASTRNWRPGETINQLREELQSQQAVDS